MSYVDGFVIAVPTANKQQFIEHARLGDGVFMALGALRAVECRRDDVPEGPPVAQRPRTRSQRLTPPPPINDSR